MSNRDNLLKAISAALLAPGKSSTARLNEIVQMLEAADALERPPVDPFADIRKRAIELIDLDGQPTYVTVDAVLERVENGWIPALVALAEVESRMLDHLFRVWEHEVRARFKRLLEAADDREAAKRVLMQEGHVLHSQTPWTTLGQMTKVQEAYRERLRLPAHPHGECCTHYEEEAHAAMAAVADLLAEGDQPN